MADYTAAGIKLHAVGAVYFTKDEDDDIHAKFEYAKRAGVSVIVCGAILRWRHCRAWKKFVKQYDMRNRDS